MMRALLSTKLLTNNLQKLSAIVTRNINPSMSDSLRKYSKSTVDQEELNKFRPFGENEWWIGKEFEPLRAMNQLRVPFIRDTFKVATNTSKPLNGIKLLDVGCGPGILAEPIARLGANVLAIDPTEENIKIATNHSINDKQLSDKLKYECVTIEELAQRTDAIEYFDGVIASEVIEHVDNVELFLSSCLKCLKKGGKLFITTMNQTPIALVVGIFLAENVFRLVPQGTHTYNKFVSPQALTLLLQDYDCQVVLTHGMCYNPLTGNWSWTQNQAISYALQAIKH